MLDRLIPRQGDHPGAGEIGVADYLDGAVSASSQLRRLFSDGLIAVQAATAPHGLGFEDLDADQQDEVLRTVESNSLRLLPAPRDAHLQRLLHQPDRARISRTGPQAASAKRIRCRGRRPQLAGSRRAEGPSLQGRLTRRQSVGILSPISLNRRSRLPCRSAIVTSPRVRSITPRITSVVRRSPRVTASG